jgi:MinD superfamily P-loop ATPase
MGRLRVGEAMSPPLMRAVKDRLDQMGDLSTSDVIIDAPPGVSCPAMSAVMDSDVIILVTEPTPFGFFDLKLAHQAFSSLGKPMAVVVNRAGLGTSSVYDYCRANRLSIVAEIPYDREIAEAYSQGKVVSETSPALRDLFIDLADEIRSMNPVLHRVEEASIG